MFHRSVVIATALIWFPIHWLTQLVSFVSSSSTATRWNTAPITRRRYIPRIWGGTTSLAPRRWNDLDMPRHRHRIRLRTCRHCDVRWERRDFTLYEEFHHNCRLGWFRTFAARVSSFLGSQLRLPVESWSDRKWRSIVSERKEHDVFRKYATFQSNHGFCTTGSCLWVANLLL